MTYIYDVVCAKWCVVQALVEWNSDDIKYAGSGVSNAKPIKIDAEPWNGREFSAELVLPPLSVVVFKM